MHKTARRRQGGVRLLRSHRLGGGRAPRSARRGRRRSALTRDFAGRRRPGGGGAPAWGGAYTNWRGGGGGRRGGGKGTCRCHGARAPRARHDGKIKFFNLPLLHRRARGGVRGATCAGRRAQGGVRVDARHVILVAKPPKRDQRPTRLRPPTPALRDRPPARSAAARAVAGSSRGGSGDGRG